MAKGQEVSIPTYLTDNDWDKNFSGWRCPYFRIPGAEFESFFGDGKPLQIHEYEVNQKLEMVLWRSTLPKPKELAFVVRLTKNLSTKEATDRWKVTTAIMAAIIAAVLPELTKVWLGNKDYSNTTPAPPEVVTTVVPTPALTPTPTVSTPTPTPTLVNKYKEKYANGEFPLPQCGEVIVGRPVYPIFIPYEGDNLGRVRSQFCEDAYPTRGDAYYTRSKVVVASFSNEEEADIFLEFIKEYFDGARKGQPQ